MLQLLLEIEYGIILFLAAFAFNSSITVIEILRSLFLMDPNASRLLESKSSSEQVNSA